MQPSINAIAPDRLDAIRPSLIRFVRVHGDRKITAKSIGWLERISEHELTESLTCIVGAFDGRRLIGIACAADAGRQASFAVVHPEYRGKGVGPALLRHLMSRLGSLECIVSCDNAPSMAMCFRAGMTAVELTTGGTGKPALRFVSSIGAQRQRPGLRTLQMK